MSDERVSEDEEFSHDGGDGDFGWFSVGDEACVEAFEVGVEAACAEGGHVESFADVGASAADVSLAVFGSAIGGEGGEAGKGGDLLGIDASQFVEAGA